MIYVTVGTAVKGIEFTRLVRAMDRIAGELNLDVLIQRGSVDYVPQHARHVRYVRFDEALRLFADAQFIVGHCGVGTVLMGMRFRKPMIIVPRRLDAGELDIDDHQMQLAAEIEHIDGIRVIYDVDRLEAAVREFVDSPPPRPRPTENRARLAAAVRRFLADFSP